MNMNVKEASEITAGAVGRCLLWFNKLVPQLLTLGAAQGLHELSHIVTAWSKQVRIDIISLFFIFRSLICIHDYLDTSPYSSSIR